MIKNIKPYLILGYGSSGKASEKFLQFNKIPFVIHDDKHQNQIDPDDIKHDSFEKIIVSPGIPPSHPILVKAKMQKIPICLNADLVEMPKKIKVIIGPLEVRF